MKLITARPRGMSYEKYRRVRAKENRNLRRYLSGKTRFVWVSCIIREVKGTWYRKMVQGTFYGCVRKLVHGRNDQKSETVNMGKPEPVRIKPAVQNRPNPFLTAKFKLKSFAVNNFWALYFAAIFLLAVMLYFMVKISF